jgi:hypothetical protein
VFTRRDKTTTEVVEEPLGSGKGHATPKRRDAERERRERVKGPSDPKLARKVDRQRAMSERRARNEGMMRGEERYLTTRDVGPRRRFIRDWIDTRFTAAELFLPSAVLILVVSMLGNAGRALSVLIWIALIPVIAVDSLIWTRKLRRQVGEKFPNEPRKGDTLYAFMRAMLVRRMRTPRAAVARRKLRG